MHEGIPKTENNLENHAIKNGVDFVFDKNLELATIGTKEEYSQYLETIFPNSKLKDILYHGTREKFTGETFDMNKRGAGRNFGKGVYFAHSTIELEKYVRTKDGGEVVTAIVNIKNPFITCNRLNDFYGVFMIPDDQKISEYTNGCDGVINYFSLERDSFSKINKYAIEYIGEKDAVGFPTYQKTIYVKPEIREVVVEYPEQIHILGSQSDIEKFKEFVKK
jgi:hypothetical protein